MTGYLNKQRNDGNKVYEILAVSSNFMGVPLSLGLKASNVFSNSDDVYITVRISVDRKKHVAPISSKPIAPATGASQAASMSASVPVSSITASAPDKILKFKTITKYSYFESGDKWIKVLLPDLTGLKDHPAEKINVEFPTNRSFSVEVRDFKGQNWQFTVPRTQCRILP